MKRQRADLWAQLATLPGLLLLEWWLAHLQLTTVAITTVPK
jgi:hypothetical protein